uniref:TIL domain-containing protein n=1 Tax=Romanomermis culicivorax TaxID=13658 RepID=A0A915HKZ9_ROMCU
MSNKLFTIFYLLFMSLTFVHCRRGRPFRGYCLSNMFYGKCRPTKPICESKCSDNTRLCKEHCKLGCYCLPGFCRTAEGACIENVVLFK